MTDVLIERLEEAVRQRKHEIAQIEGQLQQVMPYAEPNWKCLDSKVDRVKTGGIVITRATYMLDGDECYFITINNREVYNKPFQQNMNSRSSKIQMQPFDTWFPAFRDAVQAFLREKQMEQDREKPAALVDEARSLGIDTTAYESKWQEVDQI